MAVGPFEAGEQALLIDQRENRHLVTLRPGEQFHSDRGILRHDEIIGQEEGLTLRSTLGTRYLVLRPTLAEYVLEMPRGAQVMYPKDLAALCFWADVYPGATVVEAGIGSAALTLALLRAVGQTGRVISYETRDDFAKRALKNLEARLGELENHSLRLADISEGIEEREIDRLLLDIPEPWRVVSPGADALRPGGIFACYVPTIIQSQQAAEALQGHGAFALVETFEVLMRPWQIQGMSVRPFHRMVAHTGFITIARRVQSGPGTSTAVERATEGKKG
ncbi:MAG: tRNA (adenine-N1)-methyltransferase [Candidatus Rokubacteria bacterium]|nr:tRNA (adenine-N1)-methyltransferase [Candidatus Rokubacteria bacterium]